MVLFYLSLYVTIIVGISYYFSQKNSDSDFLIASRNRPIWQIVCSKIAATIGTGFFLIYTAYTYQYGWSALILLTCFTLAILVFSFWAVPKIYRQSRESNYLTMGDFVSGYFNSKLTGLVLDRATVIFMFIWVTSTFIGGAKIISSYLDITYDAAILVTLVFVACYVYLSGYRAVLITDVIQTVIIFGLLMLAVFGLINSADMSVVASTLTEPLPVVIIVGIIIFGFFPILSSPDRYQLIYSARSEKTAVWGSALGVIPFALAFIPLILIGLYMRSAAPGSDPDIVFMQFLNEHTSPLYLELAAVMLVAGLMSTLDTWLYAIATHIRPLQKLSSKVAVRTVRSNMMVASVVLATIAFIFRDLLTTAILGAIVVVTTSIAMLYIFFNGKYSERFLSSLGGGIAGATFGVAFFGAVPETMITPIVGGLAGLLIPVKLLKRLQTN